MSVFINLDMHPRWEEDELEQKKNEYQEIIIDANWYEVIIQEAKRRKRLRDANKTRK